MGVKTISKALKSSVLPKIFCISVQRTATTSVGQFFIDHDYRVATWRVSKKNNWTLDWFKGDFEAIFNSSDFKYHQVFEDDPWWCPEFYKLLFHRFPKAKFVLVTRDPEKWYDSMYRHSGGKSPGNTQIHASIYNREKEFYDLDKSKLEYYGKGIDNLLPLEGLREHYTNWYKIRNRDVQEFFQHLDPSRLIKVDLESRDKWKIIGNFFNISVSDDYEVHMR